MSLPEALTAEARRVFQDRLVGEAAGASFDEMLLAALRNRLGFRGEGSNGMPGLKVSATCGSCISGCKCPGSPMGMQWLNWTPMNILPMTHVSLLGLATV